MRRAGTASLLAAPFLFGLALAPVAGAATISPTVATDDITNNGNCTLREAVQASNTNAAVDLCTPGSASAADNIVLEAPLYLLTLPGAGEIGNQTGDLDLAPTTASPLTIEGAIDEAEIDGSSGANTDRVMEKSSGASSTSLTLNRIQLDDGTPPAGENGGALRVVGSTKVTLNSSRVTSSDTDSRGGGMLVVDDLTLNNSTVSGNASTETGGNVGGGIATNGDVTINRSTITGNAVNSPDDANDDDVSGGGIAATIGSLTVVDSTISGNSVNPADSGDNALGAGIFAEGIPVTIRRSLIVGNLVTGTPFARLGGGLFYRDLAPLEGPLEIENSTFAGNLGGAGGFIFGGGANIQGGVTKIAASTFMVNNAATGKAIQYDDFTAGDNPASSVTVRGSIFDESDPACSGPDPITSAGFNIEKNSSCPLTGTGDVLSTDPNVQDLDDNGGPTQTGDLLSSSPAVDKIPLANCLDADGAPLATDQRGAPRGFDEDGDTVPECDKGAYELNRCQGTVADSVANGSFTGTAASEVIVGSVGDDEIDPLGGDDKVCGGGGNDFVIEKPSGGTDEVFGEGGSDTLSLDSDATAVPGTINLAGAVASIPSGTGTTASLSSIENGSGSSADDTLIGDGGPNTLDGRSGSDAITGNGGGDTLIGGFESDQLFARDGVADTVNCGSGLTDSAQTDQLSLDSVTSCEAVDALAEPQVLLPIQQPAAQPLAKKKCRKGRKLRKGRCVKKKRKRR